MKRQIKFRFWNGEKMDYSPEVHDCNWLNDNFSPDLEDDGTWGYMQFTGLKDKNGKDIYESDVLCIDDEIVADTIGGFNRYEPQNRIEAVEWDDSHGMWITKSDTLAEQYADSEVIGNIYENKDLIS